MNSVHPPELRLFRPMAKPPTSLRANDRRAIGARLRLIRIAYGRLQGYKLELNKSDFPRLCKIGITAWHNAETGYQRIGLDNANRLRERTGVGLDYIYHGAVAVVPQALLAEIEKLELEESRVAKSA